MNDKNYPFDFCDDYVKQFVKVLDHPVKNGSRKYFTGVDLGTACVVMVVLDEERRPVAGCFEYADVVKDGMVVNYIGAIQIVRKMKEQIEESLGTELVYAAGAIPPGTDSIDGGAVRNVIEAAGFEVTNMLDEPTAANMLLQMKNGAVVDIGGGTTGISILKDGKILSVDDEPTGGTHFTLVLAGAYKIPFAQADLYKRDSKNHKEIFPLVKPVIDKVASIITRAVRNEKVESIVLVGGSSCLTGIENVIEKQTGIKTYKPINPLFVTPIGIALSCTDKVME